MQLEDGVGSRVVAAKLPMHLGWTVGVWLVLQLVMVSLDGVQVKPHTADGVGG